MTRQTPAEQHLVASNLATNLLAGQTYSGNGLDRDTIARVCRYLGALEVSASWTKVRLLERMRSQVAWLLAETDTGLPLLVSDYEPGSGYSREVWTVLCGSDLERRGAAVAARQRGYGTLIPVQDGPRACEVLLPSDETALFGLFQGE